MTPRAAIAMLDRQIARHGQDATFFSFDDEGKEQSSLLRIFARGYIPNEIGGGIQQGDTAVVVSATDWLALDFGKLPERIDQLRFGGRTHTVENVDFVHIGDVLVRINLQVRG